MSLHKVLSVVAHIMFTYGHLEVGKRDKNGLCCIKSRSFLIEH